MALKIFLKNRRLTNFMSQFTLKKIFLKNPHIQKYRLQFEPGKNIRENLCLNNPGPYVGPGKNILKNFTPKFALEIYFLKKSRLNFPRGKNILKKSGPEKIFLKN